MIMQVFAEGSMSCTQMFEWKNPNSARPEKVRLVKSKVKSMLNIFFNIKRTVLKELVLTGQTLNSIYPCDFSW
jgi:hypothetical protein